MISTIQADAFRHPWDLCALAPSETKRLTGMPLEMAAAGLPEAIDARAHCTHLLDLSELMLGLTNRGVERREYEIEIPYRINHNTTASIRRDGEVIFNWTVEGSRIATPPPFAGRDIGRGFARLIKDTFDADAAEAALVLRRAVYISSGRGNLMDGIVKAPISGVCFVQNPRRGPLARRWFHTRKDVTNSVHLLRQCDDAWLDGGIEASRRDCVGAEVSLFRETLARPKAIRYCFGPSDLLERPSGARASCRLPEILGAALAGSDGVLVRRSGNDLARN